MLCVSSLVYRVRSAVLRPSLAIFLALMATTIGAQTGQGQPLVVNEDVLEQRLRETGFEPPEKFKALVGIVEAGAEESRCERWFDWAGTSTDRDDWWPASTVKLYAAIAALQRNRRMGFRPRARLLFNYSDEEPVERTLREIVRRAIIRSDNHAFNRLVEYAGFNWINQRFFVSRNGLQGTVFLRAYNSHRLDPETGYGVNRASPPIMVRSQSRERLIPARVGRGEFSCPEQGNCTTLRSLADAIRRVMLHEELPAEQRFRVGPRELRVLRGALEAPRREHGRLLVESIRRGFGGDESVRVYHKPGFAYQWSSEVMAVHQESTGRWFFISAAAWPGRRSLDDGLERIARLLAGDGFGGEVSCD